MSVNCDLRISWWQEILIKILSSGLKITHFAVVMDGNRRFARKLQQKSELGHKKGSKKFFKMLNMAAILGIQELTVYAFSVENFKRPADELQDFMSLILKILQKMLDNIEEYKAKGIKFTFIGELHLIDEECQKYFQKLMKATEENSDFLCNIAVAYASRVEITRAIKNAVQNPKTLSEDVDHEVLEEFLYIPKGRPVDLWLRTSGETRFSDFLTWQSDKAVMHFSPVLWPEFGAWDLSAFTSYERAFSPFFYGSWSSTIKASEYNSLDKCD
ncbi:dehydrodolichyl diphosphate synthase complex subunit DHDDS-like [Phlebotomus argentipes]|uniref:dehydrodolichyl diphosphate synthase complex subunit DHDDS-like n=1 Tax=Phlebotomus argentipes TaxID=94469 RepID=UPI00289378FA|nr:dehydrodolichyl diphosphate synthase complex subunit DHDDS-like [Phlebotomus argentipes]